MLNIIRLQSKIILGHMNSIGWNSSIQYFRSGYYFLDIQYVCINFITVAEANLPVKNLIKWICPLYNLPDVLKILCLKKNYNFQSQKYHFQM